MPSSKRSDNKKRRIDKISYPKIDHVYDTENDEKMWIVKTTDGKKRKHSRKFINKHNLVADDTTFTVRKIGCISSYKIGTKFRFVFWQGFKEPTEESCDFRPTVATIHSEDEK